MLKILLASISLSLSPVLGFGEMTPTDKAVEKISFDSGHKFQKRKKKRNLDKYGKRYF